MHDDPATPSVLTVEQLIDRTLVELLNRFQHEDVRLPNRVFVEMADDSDYHRTAKGHFFYDIAYIVTLPDGRGFVLSRGTKDMSYPGENFRGDLIGIPIPAGTAAAASSIMQTLTHDAEYFEFTLVMAHVSGNLAGKKSNLGGRISERVKAERDGWIAREYEVSKKYITLGAQPVYDETVRYKPDTPEHLATIIAEEIMREQPQRS